MRRRAWELSFAAAAALAACNGTEPAAPPATINVTATDTELDVGETAQATAIALTSSGKAVDARTVTWSTSDSLVARVSSTGAVVGAGTGSATITAAFGEVRGTLVVKVVDRAHSVSFTSRPMLSALTGDTTLARAVVRDSALQPMPARSVQWTSRNEAIATVAANGVVEGVAKGRTWIVARSGSVRDSAEVVILQRRKGPNRQLALRVAVAGGSEELWLWIPGRYPADRLSIPGRSVRAFQWSYDGRWMTIAYRPSPGRPPFVEMVDADVGTRLTIEQPGVETGDLSPDYVWVALSVNVGGRRDIVVMQTDGSDRRQLTNGPSSFTDPLWAPDGRQVAYLGVANSDDGIGELWVADVKGSAPRRFAPRARNVAWSPDAKQLAFDDGEYVWVVARDGTGLTRISPSADANLATENGRPRWSADARRLVYTLSGEVRLVTPQGTLIYPRLVNASVKHADLSPDGQLVSYFSSNGLVVAAASVGGALYLGLSVNSGTPLPVWRP